MLRDAFQWLWGLFWAVWMLAALDTKRTVRRQSMSGRILQTAGVALGFLLLLGSRTWPPLNVRFVPDGEATRLCGLVIVVAGIAFAFWARLTLGRTWSSAVTLKEDHQLIRRGPYRIVRHPIYAGILLAALGTAVGYGKVQCLVGVAIVFLAFRMKWITEERFLEEQFGAEYLAYRREVSAIVPGWL
jgi:protein-S-isoprenylcysteine O-methyltransferase